MIWDPGPGTGDRESAGNAGPRTPNPEPRRVVLGITGPVAGGKTAAADCLARRGARVIELDAVGHRLLDEPEVRAEVDAAFPEAAGAGAGPALRAALAKIVFADPAALGRLERILHGRMCDRVREQVAGHRASGRGGIVVIAGALLFEMGLDEICDRVVVIDAPAGDRAGRALASRGWGPEEVRRREARQLPAEVKRGRADRVVDNTGSQEDLEAEMAAIWEECSCP